MKTMPLSRALSSILLVLYPASQLSAQTVLPDIQSSGQFEPVGSPAYPVQHTDVLELNRGQSSYALPSILEGQIGLIAEGVFGGIDHPRLSIRGSGLQRGTQPAGRGLEIREQGLPLGYADTSYDFVESIDPLTFDEVRILRSGRAVATGSATLGGVIDFIRFPKMQGSNEQQFRYETGSFGLQSFQGSATTPIGSSQLVANLTDYRKTGFRQHNQQEALRSQLSVEGQLNESAWRWRAGLSDLSSQLKLPGPQNFAQISSGSTNAQSGNIRGNWRRITQRTRISSGLNGPTEYGQLGINMSYQLADVQFIRRDEQDESNDDLAFQLHLKPYQSAWFFEALYQRNQRQLQQYLNGGGTMPTFTGRRGLKWADNTLKADRLALTAGHELDLNTSTSTLLAVGLNYHTRNIQDNFNTSGNRPTAELNKNYIQWSGLAELRYKLSSTDTLFLGFHSVGEPPTYDMLLLNNAGGGVGEALINGTNPRRPTINPLEAQRQNTLEAGWRHASEHSLLDLTFYYARLNREVISTLDPINQINTNLRNADNTQRVGAELALQTIAATNLLESGADLQAKFSLNWVDARFDADPVFGSNTLPVVTPLGMYSAVALKKSNHWQAELFAQTVSRGAFVDYANTVRAGDYLTLGIRGQIEINKWVLFAEGRNLTNERYASTVIGATLNAAGADTASFAPGEPQSLTIGAQYRF